MRSVEGAYTGVLCTCTMQRWPLRSLRAKEMMAHCVQSKRVGQGQGSAACGSPASSCCAPQVLATSQAAWGYSWGATRRCAMTQQLGPSARPYAGICKQPLVLLGAAEAGKSHQPLRGWCAHQHGHASAAMSDQGHSTPRLPWEQVIGLERLERLVEMSGWSLKTALPQLVDPTRVRG